MPCLEFSLVRNGAFEVLAQIKMKVPAVIRLNLATRRPPRPTMPMVRFGDVTVSVLLTQNRIGAWIRTARKPGGS